LDEIRNLEYEYDLMDNVTQRQNHNSGLSERFTYDALERSDAVEVNIICVIKHGLVNHISISSRVVEYVNLDLH
jgi:hypothetical protein